MSRLDNQSRYGTSQARAYRASYARSQSSSSGRSGQAAANLARVNAARQGRNPRRKRKPPFDWLKVIIGILALLAAVAVVVFALRFFSKAGGGRTSQVAGSSASLATSPAATLEAQLNREVRVNGFSILGMSREKARKALMDQYPWGMEITYKDQVYKVKNLMEDKVDKLLDDIYQSQQPKEDYALDASGLEEGVKAQAAQAAGQWNLPAKNGAISGYDKEKGQFTYSDGADGLAINQDKLVSDMEKSLASMDLKAVIPAEAKAVKPDITKAQAKALYQVIGTFTTTTTANKDRNTNIRLASEAMDGMILQPGEEFSFNNATGERSTAKGYRPAGAYLNGVLIEEPGGGVCQVSSTLYNAVVFAGLTTTERHAHSYEPTYVIPGEDAMVSYGGPDMKFVNNSPSAIGIRTSFKDRKLKMSIVGIPILEKGVELSMTSKKTAQLDPPAPIYEEDQTLEPGVEKVLVEAKQGSRWVTNLVTKKDGVVVSDEFLHNSTYRGKPATIARNTSGVVIPAPTTQGQPAQEGLPTQPAQPSQEPAQPGQEPSSQAPAPSQPAAQTQPSQEAPAGPGQQTGQPAQPAESQVSPAGPGAQDHAIAPNPLS